MRSQRHGTNVFTPGKDTVHIVQEDGWAAGPVSTGAENLTPTGIRSPNRPAATRPTTFRCNLRLLNIFI